MNLYNQKIIINIDSFNQESWKIVLANKLKFMKSKNIVIDCKNIDLCCTDISEIISIADQYNCNIISFYSSSLNTIISCQSLGYTSQLIVEKPSDKTLKVIEKNINFSNYQFHQGTLRSGEYLDSPGDLLILGDVNPGAKVSAEGNIIIWGRLLGIAHAGSKGNSKSRISAIQLRPVQLRIANKVARGPKEKPQLGLAEQARIDSDQIIIYPLDAN